jgi:hypothetical protein
MGDRMRLRQQQREAGRENKAFFHDQGSRVEGWGDADHQLAALLIDRGRTGVMAVTSMAITSKAR